MPIIQRSWEDHQLNLTSLTSDFTAATGNSYRIDPTSGDFNVYLPLASGVGGQDIELYVEYSGVNAITLTASGSDTINGVSPTLDVEDRTNIRLTSNGDSDWRIFYGYKDPSHGHMKILEGDGAATATNTSYAKLNGTTTLVEGRRFTMPANNKLVYTGKSTKQFTYSFVSSCDVNTANTLVHITIAINGTPVEDLAIDRTFANSNDHGPLPSCGLLTLNQNDYVELWGKSDKSINLTVDHLSLTIREDH